MKTGKWMRLACSPADDGTAELEIKRREALDFTPGFEETGQIKLCFD
jgi:hypothetical protein